MRAGRSVRQCSLTRNLPCSLRRRRRREYHAKFARNQPEKYGSMHRRAGGPKWRSGAGMRVCDNCWPNRHFEGSYLRTFHRWQLVYNGRAGGGIVVRFAKALRDFRAGRHGIGCVLDRSRGAQGAQARGRFLGAHPGRPGQRHLDWRAGLARRRGRAGGLGRKDDPLRPHPRALESCRDYDLVQAIHKSPSPFAKVAQAHADCGRSPAQRAMRWRKPSCARRAN